MRIARLFDRVDAVTGPLFADDHHTLEPDKAAKLLAYLQASPIVLFTTGTMDDVVDRQRGQSVPLSFRTDGEWVWSEATSYYLEHHHLAPDPDLVAAIHANDFVVPAVDAQTLEQAVTLLTAPDEDDPVVWSS
jgi:hypothetical protein